MAWSVRDRAVIPAPLLVVTDRRASDRPLAETVRACLAGGARWFWLREKDLDAETRRTLALELLTLVRGAGGRLTIGGDIGLAAAIGADGVHLGDAGGSRAGSPGKADAIGFHERVIAARAGLGRTALVGVSAHDVAGIRAAKAAGADYATISPIFPTASKPGYGPALGLPGLREAACSGLPVVALGGIGLDTAADCLSQGAAGVAVMGEVMRASDPTVATRRILQAMSAAGRP